MITNQAWGSIGATPDKRWQHYSSSATAVNTAPEVSIVPPDPRRSWRERSTVASTAGYLLAVSTQLDRGPYLYPITGDLVEGLSLKRPLTVVVTIDDDECLVSEPGFHMHGYGADRPSAMADFRRSVAGSYIFLSRDEAKLGPQLKEQLEFLRSIIFDSTTDAQSRVR